VVAALIALALAASPPVTHDTIPVFVGPPGRSVDYVFAWSAGSGPPPSLGVFTRPRTLADVVPAEAQMLARVSGGRLDRARLLLQAGTTRIYAFPADNKQLCFVRTPGGGGNCIGSLLDGAYPEIQPRSDVWGIVDDGAVRVDVAVAHRVLRAKLGRNAFFLALPAGAVVPSRIVVHERDRTRHVYDVKRCSVDHVSPLSSPLGPPC